MTLLPLASFAADLDPAKIVIGNRSFGSADPLDLTAVTYNTTTEISIDGTHFYKNEDFSDVPSTAAIQTLTAGKYFLKVTGVGVYEGQTVATSFWVYPAKLEIDFDAKSKTYGSADPAFTYAITYKEGGAAFDNSENILELTVGRESGNDVKAGGYAYTFTAGNANYELTRKTGDDDVFTINAKAITPAVTVGSDALTYNAANQAPAITVKDGSTTIAATQYDVTYAYSTTEAGVYGAYGTDHKDAGWYKVTVTMKNNYDGSAADKGPFEIKKAALNVYVNNVEKTYDATNTIPAVTFGYSGLQGADAENPKPFGASDFTAAYVSVDAYGNVDAKEYSLKPVVDAPAYPYANYDVTLLNTGKLTVNPKAITVKPIDQEKFFDDPDPAFSYGATWVNPGAYEGTDNNYIVNAYTVSRSNAGVEAVGEYANVLELTKRTGLNATYTRILGNYTITPGKGKFTIKKATLYVYPKNVTITYGDAAPELEVIATNSNGTTVELTTTPTVKFKSLDATPTDAGTYVLTLEGDAAAEGYATVEKLDGQYTIEKKALTITAKAQALHVGDTKAALATYDKNYSKVTFAGRVGEDKIKYELVFNAGDGEGQIALANFTDGDATKALLVAAVGSYDKGITVNAPAAEDGFANKNYTITVAEGKLTVVTAGTFVLDDTDADLAARIEAVKDTKKAVTFTDRTLKAGQWNTIVLPFATSVKEVSEKLGYAVVDVLKKDNASAETISLVLAFGELPANEPFMVQPMADINLNTITFDGDGTGVMVKYSATPEVADAAGHKFIGTYTGYNVTSADKTEYYYSSTQKKFVNSSKSTKIGIMRAYLKDASAGAAAKFISVETPEGFTETTAIGEVKAQQVKNNEGWYTINGVKLEAAPTQKGIYINNGKKVVVK